MKAVIFDMDGTILNTIEDISGAVNYILDKYGMPKRSVDEVKSFVGNGLRRTLELSVKEGTDESFIDNVFDEFVNYYRNHSKIHTKPYDGIVEAIKSFKDKGYRLAVVSNKRQEAVEALCTEFYTGLFDHIEGDRDGIHIKPAPDMILSVLKTFSISADEAVYVGDSDVDIMTANNSGLKGVFVSWGFRGREFLVKNGAQIIVDNTDELVAAISNM